MFLFPNFSFNYLTQLFGPPVLDLKYLGTLKPNGPLSMYRLFLSTQYWPRWDCMKWTTLVWILKVKMLLY